MIHPAYHANCPAARRLWRLVTLLGALQGLLAVGLIFQTRSESGGLVLGISSTRLGMMGLILLASLCLLGLFFVPQAPGRFERLWVGLVRRLERRRTWGPALLASGLLLFLSLMWVITPSDLLDEFTLTIFLRLRPLAVWLAGLSFLSGLGLLVLRHGPNPWALRSHQPAFYIVLLLLMGVFLAWGWAARVVLPVEGERLGWNRQGAPLTGIQVFIAWAAGMLMVAMLVLAQGERPERPRWLAWPERLRPARFDLLVALLIWLMTVIVWQSTPLTPNWFVSQPVYPNYEYYPSSDARAYDVSAQTALVGIGYRFYDSPYVRRSLLAMYLTLLHLIGGQSYERVILLQILALALLPVLVYFVTRRLHNRIAGVMAAVMVLLREANAIRLATEVTTSHVKLIMADLPATLLTLVFTLLVVKWLQHIQQRPWLALAAGGALGFSMLVRLETFVFAVPVALLATLLLWRQRCYRLWLQSGLAALLGVSLVLAPWVWRNYRLTGEIFIDHPYFSMGLLIQRFNPSGLPAIGAPDPGEGFEQAPAAATPTPPAPSAKVQPLVVADPAAPHPDDPAPTPTPVDGVAVLEAESGKAINNITRDLGQYLAVAAGHILNSTVQSFLVLPTAYRGLDSAVGVVAHRSVVEYLAACCSAESYAHRLPYWRGWDGAFRPEGLLLLAFNLSLIAVGMAQAWKRWCWAGLAPLLMGVMYVVFNGLLRNSGGRYVLPVDWVNLMYFSAGLAHVSLGLLAYLTGRGYPQMLAQETGVLEAGIASAALPAAGSRRRFYGLVLGLFLLAGSVPLLEQLFPLRYPAERQQQMLQAVLGSDQLSVKQRQGLQTLLDHGAVVYAGRALYPRFFPPKVGDEVGESHPFAPRPYPRLGFYLVGLRSTNMVIPLDKKPASFPNASDVLVIACPSRDLLAVARFGNTGSLKLVLLREPFPDHLACPLPAQTP